MKFKTLGVVSSLALVASLTTPAYAQDEAPVEEQAEEGDGRTNEILVTAEFREARLQDTPIAITAVNAEMLEARGQTDIAQVAAQSPNVVLKPQGQGGGSGLVAFIRGVGQVDFNFALEPGVGMYVDDVYFPTLTGSLLDLTDVERVEVLRGPQGTLAGRNSIGGAIKIFSRRPNGTGRGSFQVTYGSYDRVEARGFADFAITDNLFARVAGTAKDVDGYITRLDYGVTHPGSNVLPTSGGKAKLGTLGGTSYVGGRLSLVWQPSDRFEAFISADYSKESSEAGALVTRYANNPARDANGNPWLVGADGTGIPFDCRFVPYTELSFATSCSTTPAGYDARYVTYASFLDSKPPTSQLPFKPYAAQPIQHLDSWGAQANLTYDISDDFQIVSISSYRNWESLFGQDADGSPVPQQQLDNQLTFRAWSQELRFNGTVLDGMLDFTLGGFYIDQDGQYTARVDLNYAGIDFVHGPDTTPSSSLAGFLNATLHATDRLNITGGLRYSEDEKTYTYRRSNPDGTVPFRENGSLLGPTVEWEPGLIIPTPPICEFFVQLHQVQTGVPGAAITLAGPTGVGNTPNCLLTGLYDVSDTFKGNRLDYRGVIDYRFSDQFLAYASYTTGYKGGGVNPRPFFGPSAGECADLPPGVIAPCNQLGSFNPETLTTYEVGFKTDLFDRRLRFNAAGFYNEYDDIILSLSACPGAPCIKPANVGAAHVKGLEFEVQAYPVEGLSLDASLALLDFDYTDLLPGLAVTQDMITPYTPETTWSGGAQYDHETDVGTFSIRADGSYQSSIFGSAVNADSNAIDSYFLADGRLSWTSADEDWQVSLNVKNIFDKYYVLTTFDQRFASGLVAETPGLPRTWSITVKRNFGSN